MTAAAMKTGVYAQRLLENEYVQGNLGRAAENLKAAYKRASKRRVSPAGDEKVLGQLRGAVLLIAEAASALKADRQKPKPRWGRRAACSRRTRAMVASSAPPARAKRGSSTSSSTRKWNCPWRRQNSTKAARAATASSSSTCFRRWATTSA